MPWESDDIVDVFLGKEVGGKKVRLLASAFAAFFPSFIRHSRYATPDIPLAFFIAAPFVFLNYKQVLKAQAEEKASYHLGASGLGWGGNLFILHWNMA